MGDEGERGDRGGQPFLSHLDFEFGAFGGKRGVDIAHGDGPFERGREAAAGDAADLRITRIDQRAFAGGHPAVDGEPDALLRGPVGERFHHGFVTHPAAFLAAALGQRETEIGGDGIGFSGDVMAIERQARFEPQAVACAQTNRAHFDFGA